MYKNRSRQPDFGMMFNLIFERLVCIEKLLSGQSDFQDDDELIDSRKMRLLTKMSDRTLLRRRKEGTLPYYRHGGKIYYPKTRALRALRQPDFRLSKK